MTRSRIKRSIGLTGRRIDARQRRFAAFDRFRLIAEAADESFEQTALHRVVIDDQYETGHGPLS